MAIGINTNVASLSAQNELNSSKATKNEALERLSSGLRINSAKDDAAGLAISTRFEAQINGLDQASRNANDGISLAQTAEGALEETTNSLQRVRELAVQAANGTNTDSDRASLQNEAGELTSEIQRVADTTQFNGQNILDGNFDGKQFQVGANEGQTIDVSIDDASADSLGAVAEVSSTRVTAGDSISTGTLDGTNLDVDINGTKINSSDLSSDGVSTEADQASAIAVANAINNSDIEGGVTAEAQENVTTVGAIAGGTDVKSAEFTINGVGIDTGGSNVTSGDSTGVLQDAINDVSNQTGVTAELNDSNQLELTAEDGRNIAIEGTGTSANIFQTSANVNSTSPDNVTTAQVELQSSESINVVANQATATTEGQGFSTATTSVDTDKSVANVDVSTVEGANDAINQVDRALDQVNNIRSELGATQNRFDSTISNLETTSENLSAANSRIRDADFAAESAKLQKANVLQQAGISVLSQANQSPQQALSLLQ
ncbi:flagellin [Salicola sp. Rm-C-2C1-2]|uniref:flagellin N-terminal helical domain-containing protein n=1 Tax=Salicola sp. Rm-C-2C1-2 TaxID=3141321 RepID=UPI0032E451D8